MNNTNHNTQIIMELHKLHRTSLGLEKKDQCIIDP